MEGDVAGYESSSTTEQESVSEKEIFKRDALRGLASMSGWVTSWDENNLFAANTSNVSELVDQIRDINELTSILLRRARRIQGQEAVLSTAEKLEEDKAFQTVCSKYFSGQKDIPDDDLDIDTFIEGVSVFAHDLRTPLTSMLGYAQLFQRKSGEIGGVDQSKYGLRIKQGFGKMAEQIKDVYESAAAYPVEELDSNYLSIKLKEIFGDDMAKALGLNTSIKIPSEIVSEGVPFVASDKWINALIENIQENVKNRGYANRDAERKNEVLYADDGSETATYGKMIVEVKRAEDTNSLVVRISDFGAGFPVERLKEGFQMWGSDNLDKGGNGIGIGSKVKAAIKYYSGGNLPTTVIPKNIIRDETGTEIFEIFASDGKLWKKNILHPATPTEIVDEEADVSTIGYAGAMTEIGLPIQTLKQVQERNRSQQDTVISL